MVLTFSTFAANIEIDRQWYLAGEKMSVTITADGANIAYAELCDTRGLVNGVAVNLVDGKGTGALEIPAGIHSGYYVLSAYTRDNANVSRQFVAIVNPLIKSENDDIEWVKLSDDTLSFATILEDEPVSVASLADKKDVGIRETEGHIVMARVKNVLVDSTLSVCPTCGQFLPPDSPLRKIHGITTFEALQIVPSISIVGKQVHYFEGKMLNDTTAIFFTFGVQGKQPLVLSAASATGKSLPIEMISPFAQLIPEKVPHLIFCYNRSEVEQRSKDMQLHQIAIAPEKEELVIGGQVDDGTIEKGVPLNYDDKVFGLSPVRSYNLDEYRQFYTIGEVITEYISNVRSSKINGVNSLVLYDANEGLSSWPALVFIDGMPVIDVDRLLKYDARRIQFINEYEGRFTFGGGIYKGIVSVVSRSGSLTNYPTEPNTQYIVYDFPQ